MFRPLLISMFLTSTALADTWTVDDDGKADFDNIQAAVDAASKGDEIIVMPGTYTGSGIEVVTIRGKAIWLHSSGGAGVTIIDGENLRGGLYIDGENLRGGLNCNSQETEETIIEGFTITRGGGIPHGGGLFTNLSSPTVINCEFTDNTANTSGGAIYNQSNINNPSNPTIINCTIKNNYSGYVGGGICNRHHSNATLINCTIKENSAYTFGGGIYNSGSSTSSATLIDTVVCSNTPDQIYGDWTDNGGNWVADECPPYCPDINGDGDVNVTDLLAVIDQWGLTDSPADVTGDGVVNVSDVLLIISNWGPCE